MMLGIQIVFLYDCILIFTIEVVFCIVFVLLYCIRIFSIEVTVFIVLVFLYGVTGCNCFYIEIVFLVLLCVHQTRPPNNTCLKELIPVASH